MSAPKKNSLNSKIRVARVFKMIYIQAKSQDVLNFYRGGVYPLPSTICLSQRAGINPAPTLANRTVDHM
jgi:hypothetical protein